MLPLVKKFRAFAFVAPRGEGKGRVFVLAGSDGEAVAVDPGAGKLDERHMPLCRAGNLEGLWKQGGLQDVAGAPLDFTMKFGSFADYWEPFLLGQGPAGAYVRRLNGGQRQALRAELKRKLALHREDAPFSLFARAWAVRGIVREH